MNTIDISKNTRLVSLNLGGNKLNNLDVKNNTLLQFLGFSSNNLTSIDLTSNTVLSYLWGSGNKLTSLNLVNNQSITNVDVSDNEIETFDISTFTNHNRWSALTISNNKLETLKLNNGNNSGLINFDGTTNINLKCIQVDNVANANAAGEWKKDVAASYNTNCGVLSIEDNLRESIQIYPNPISDVLYMKTLSNFDIKSVRIYDTLGRLIIESNKNTINVSNLQRGIYMIKIKTNKV